MLAEENDDEEEIANTRPDETVQFQGSDRPNPAIDRRRAYWKDRSRATLQTISRRDLSGRINPLYDAYASDVSEYQRRRRAKRGNPESRRQSTVVSRLHEESQIPQEQRGQIVHVPGFVDGGLEATLMLAGKESHETYE